MTSKEIRESGLLELYALDEITDVNRKIVERAIAKDPDLLAELQQIDLALFNFAKVNGVEPSNSLKDEILENVRSTKDNILPQTKEQKIPERRRSRMGSNWLLLSLLTGSLLFIGYQFNSIQGYEAQLQNTLADCDSLATVQSKNMEQLIAIQDPSNNFYAFTATEKYSSTDIILLSNTSSEKNFLKIDNLPELNANQTFKLWSLKADQDPIPLTVFVGERGAIIPLDFEEGTSTYAVTIEQQGGALVPNLEQLIATVKV